MKRITTNFIASLLLDVPDDVTPEQVAYEFREGWALQDGGRPQTITYINQKPVKLINIYIGELTPDDITEND